MNKFLGLIFLFIIYFISPANADWEGSCYIQYDGKVVVKNEICSIRQDGFSINPTSHNDIAETNDFQIVAVRDVPCDDGSDGCAYYFYADKFILSFETFYQINYNIDKERTKYPANLGEDFKISEYKPNDSESGLCFIKDKDKFCFAYAHKETEEDNSASNLNLENPKLYCSQIKESGEYGDKYLFDLNSKTFKNLEISNSFIKFTFETNGYFVSSVLNKNTKLLNKNAYKDSERKILEFSQSWHCEDNLAKLKEFIQTPEEDERTVIESNIDVAWKIDDKFIIPECFDYVWASGDKYETFFDEYIEKLESNHWFDPKFINFVVKIGTYLNKEVPLNHSIKTGWEYDLEEISLSRQLNSCMSDKPETEVMIDGEYAKTTIRYEVLETYNLKKGKELAPYIKQEFESIKKVDIAVWGGGLRPRNHPVTYGLLEIDGRKILLPLENHITINK
jgi:hypothetical protein